jgi:D-beta-D-heptose 7-phosphate kinase/D-beta-D-heptose 1-phosphate adenosyltransferase
MTPERASELLSASVGRRVLLVGDLMMDEWVFGEVERISPEAPIPVVRMPLIPEARAEKPGGAGNVAAILLSLGAAVRIAGVVGNDGLGGRLMEDLEERGADVSTVLRDAGRPTTHKVRIIAGRQQLVRIDTESHDPLDAKMSDRLCSNIEGCLGEVDVVLVADYAKGAVSARSLPQDLIVAARSGGLPICADPKPVNIDLFCNTSLVSPNESEALQAAGPAANSMPSEQAGGGEGAASGALPPEVSAAGWALRERLQADAVFVTRGAKGIAVFGPDGMMRQIAALTGSGEVGDGTGCGDAVSAASALALAAGASYTEAAEIANAAGGVVSRFVGVHSPTAGEIVDWLGRVR